MKDSVERIDATYFAGVFVIAAALVAVGLLVAAVERYHRRVKERRASGVPPAHAAVAATLTAVSPPLEPEVSLPAAARPALCPASGPAPSSPESTAQLCGIALTVNSSSDQLWSPTREKTQTTMPSS